MNFERNGWTVLLNEDKDLSEGRQKGQLRFLQTLFRSGVRDNKECEFFSVTVQETDTLVAQVIFYPDGSSAAYAYVPAIVSTDVSERLVRLDLLCNFRTAGSTVFVSSLESDTEYELTSFWPA